jgi:pimeloyl-ACP methyl ester carboxylesterase
VSEPQLVEVQSPREPRAQVLVLHGGASRPGSPEVSPTQLSVLRMVPVARRIAQVRKDLTVVRLLNSRRGWDTERTPVADVDWALGVLRDRYGLLPTCLVGHSLGGRAALLAGDRDGVRGVVALNPWVYPYDDADLSGRRVLIVHGTEDRVAPLERARAVARNLSRRTQVDLVEVPGGKHAMLRHGAAFERAAARFVADTVAAT